MTEPLRLFVRVCVLIALWVRLLAPMPAGAMLAAAGPLGEPPICHSDAGQPNPGRPEAPPHDDCALCPICLTTAFPSLAAPGGPVAAPPAVVASRPVAPPRILFTAWPVNPAAYPRGPPV